MTQIEEGVDTKDILHRMYTGETSRTIRVRSKQHFDDYIKCAKTSATPNDPDAALSSFMWDHHCNHHGGGPEVYKGDYKFDIIQQCRDPMTRQHSEAARIKMELDGKHIDRQGNSRTVISLNRKHEFFAPNRRNFSEE